jgi:hypothetical protein
MHLHSSTAFAALLFFAAAARATVLFHEPTTMTLQRTTVLAVGVVRAVEGEAPFTNARPPTVVLEVERAVRGCKRGDSLRVPDWTAGTPRESWKPTMRVDPEEARREWLAEAAPAPAVGTRVVVFLDRDQAGALRPVHGHHFRARVAYESPSDELVAQLAGMATFGVSVEAKNEQSAVGSAAPATMTIANLSDHAARFEPASLIVHVNGGNQPEGERKPWPGAPVELAAGESKSIEVDLAALFAKDLQKPNSYWIEVEGAASMGVGNHLTIRLERATPPSPSH